MSAFDRTNQYEYKPPADVVFRDEEDRFLECAARRERVAREIEINDPGCIVPPLHVMRERFPDLPYKEGDKFSITVAFHLLEGYKYVTIPMITGAIRAAFPEYQRGGALYER